MAVTESQAYEALRLAQMYLDKEQARADANGGEHPERKMVSSARVACDDAKDLLNKGDFSYAFKRAKRSLAYSVGMSHPAYKAVNSVG